MIRYGDLVLDFVIFQGKRFYAAPMQKIAVVLVVNMSLAWHKKLKM